jgi:hypothetical protein
LHCTKVQGTHRIQGTSPAVSSTTVTGGLELPSVTAG